MQSKCERNPLGNGHSISPIPFTKKSVHLICMRHSQPARRCCGAADERSQQPPRPARLLHGNGMRSRAHRNVGYGWWNGGALIAARVLMSWARRTGERRAARAARAAAGPLSTCFAAEMPCGCVPFELPYRRAVSHCVTASARAIYPPSHRRAKCPRGNVRSPNPRLPSMAHQNMC